MACTATSCSDYSKVVSTPADDESAKRIKSIADEVMSAPIDKIGVDISKVEDIPEILGIGERARRKLSAEYNAESDSRSSLTIAEWVLDQVASHVLTDVELLE
jgi:hypothetical protein